MCYVTFTLKKSELGLFDFTFNFNFCQMKNPVHIKSEINMHQAEINLYSRLYSRGRS